MSDTQDGLPNDKAKKGKGEWNGEEKEKAFYFNLHTVKLDFVEVFFGTLLVEKCCL